MNLLTRPASLAFGAVSVLGLVLGQPAIAFLGAVGWVATLAFFSMRAAAGKRHDSEISAEGRTLLRPIRELREDIAGYVRSFSDRPEISVIGGEALREADALIAHTERLVDVRDDLTKAMKGRKEAERELARLRRRTKSSVSEAESESLRSAVEARETEIERYRTVDTAMRRLVDNLHEAEAALSEIRARLATGAVGAQTVGLETDDLAGMVSRLRTLSRSFDEAEQMMEGRIK
ncbi:MAG: hypothetical protein IH945_04840 [Armatimonadetes bacterium]|nr:hypothetical protein [Armatimonadota bacterium]